MDIHGNHSYAVHGEKSRNLRMSGRKFGWRQRDGFLWKRVGCFRSSGAFPEERRALEVSVPTQPLGNHIKDGSSYLFLLLCTWWLEAQSRMTVWLEKIIEEKDTSPSFRNFTLALDKKEYRQWLGQVGILVAVAATETPECPLHPPPP